MEMAQRCFKGIRVSLQVMSFKNILGAYTRGKFAEQLNFLVARFSGHPMGEKKSIEERGMRQSIV